MTTPLRAIWPDNDKELGRLFSWLTRIGAAPAFGSRPVGWYQSHQCAAIKALEDSKAKGLPLRLRKGMIEARANVGSRASWFPVFTPNQLFTIADNACRS